MHSSEYAFMKILNRHVPMKEKFVRASLIPYMTKTSRKAIVKTSELVSKYLKNRSQQNKYNFGK